MWLYLEDVSFVTIETFFFAVLFFVFQLIMALKAKRVVLKLLPIYVLSAFSALTIIPPFLFTTDITGNWGLLVSTLISLAEIAIIWLFIGLAWVAYAIYRACNKNIK
ncbi:MAG: hypothetical protein IKU30_06700 [Clostridia bacterium]|nr:hypothetical protein [Clostridia bacterium]